MFGHRCQTSYGSVLLFKIGHKSDVGEEEQFEGSRLSRAIISAYRAPDIASICREAKMKAGHHPQLEDNTDAYSVDYMIDDEMVSSGY